MNPRLQNVPVYDGVNSSVPAEHFNLARIGLKRLQSPLRMPLPHPRPLDLILEDDAWIVVDRELNDVPVLAWLDFETRNRGLHEPVPCRRNLYHAREEIIVGKVLEAMAILMGERLAEAYPEEMGGISVLKPARDKT